MAIGWSDVCFQGLSGHPSAVALLAWTDKSPGLLLRRRAKHQKPAACFARRVKLASQKYIRFRNREIMI
jgi:hypothetical protein